LNRGHIAGRSDFSRGKVNVTPASQLQRSRLHQSRCCRYWFFSCVHHSSDSQCFTVSRTIPKLPFILF